MSLTAASVFALFAVFLCYVYLKHVFSYWERRGIPQLRPIVIPYGNIKEIGRSTQISLLIRDFYNRTKDKYPYFGVYFFQRPVLIVNDTNLIKNVLIKDFKHFQDRGVYYNERDDKLSAHLFSLNFDKWKILRNKISPTFSSGKMRFMFPIMWDVGQSLQLYMSQLIDTECVLEMKDILARFTTDVIGRCAFGIVCNSLSNPDAEFWRMGKRTFETPRHKPIITFLIGSFKRLAVMLRTKVIRDDVSDFFMNIVHETVNHRLANNIRQNDFMDILINLMTDQSDESLTINEIAAQAFVFFLAGFETSATSMTFVLYELSRNMDIQRRARSEIVNVLEKNSGELSYEAMMEMTYLDQIINETLRLHPPVGILIRKTTADYNIPETQHIVPKDSTVIIPVLGIHRDAKYFPNPEKFDPERFAPGNKLETDGLFLGFGDGPRNCIGYRFGMVQTRIGLISLLTKFEFTNCSRTMGELKYSLRNVVLSPEGGMWLKVTKI